MSPRNRRLWRKFSKQIPWASFKSLWIVAMTRETRHLRVWNIPQNVTDSALMNYFSSLVNTILHSSGQQHCIISRKLSERSKLSDLAACRRLNSCATRAAWRSCHSWMWGRRARHSSPTSSTTRPTWGPTSTSPRHHRRRLRQWRHRALQWHHSLWTPLEGMLGKSSILVHMSLRT